MDIKKILADFLSKLHEQFVTNAKSTNHFSVDCNYIPCTWTIRKQGHMTVESPVGKVTLCSTWHYSIWHSVWN